MSSKAKVFFDSVLNEMRSSKVSRLNGMVKTNKVERGGKNQETIEVSSSAISFKDSVTGTMEITVLDRPPGYPHKSGGGVTFFVEPGDNNFKRIARDILFWMSLHSTGFRDKIDPRSIIDAYKDCQLPTLQNQHWRTNRQTVAYV
jgi:hypothetical protein